MTKAEIHDTETRVVWHPHERLEARAHGWFRRWGLFVIVAFGPFVCAPPAFGQLFQFAPQAIFPGQQGPDPAALQKQRFEQMVSVRIDEIHRVCELDDDQLKRLKLGGKGAVSRAMVEWRKALDKLKKQVGGQIRIGGLPMPNQDDDDDDAGADDESLSDDLQDGSSLRPDEAEGESEGNEEDNLAEQPIPAHVAQVLAPMVQDISPDTQAVWRNTLKNVLNDQQMKRLSGADDARLAFFRESSVRNKVGELDLLLKLTPEQREKMLEVVDDVLGPTFRPPRIGGSMFVVAIGDEVALTPDDVDEFLSPTQLDAFETYLKQNKKQPVAIQMNAQVQRVLPPGPIGDNEAFFGVALNPNPREDAGAMVELVVPKGPAAEAGIKAGDRFLEVNGERLKHVPDFFRHVKEGKPGDKLKIKLNRRGEELEVEVTLAKKEKD